MPRFHSSTLRALVLAAVAVLALPMAAEAQSGKPMSALSSSAARPAFGLIVKLKAASATETAQALGATRGSRERLLGVAKDLGVSEARPVRAVGRAHLLGFGRVLGGAEAAQLARQFAARPEVEWAVPNTRERRLAAAVPNDPGFSNQWWLGVAGGANTNALAARLRGLAGFQTAWDQTTGSATAPVAVIDTGITAHSDMDANILPGYDFVSNDKDVGLYYANDGDGRDANPADPGDAVTQADIDANPSALAGCAVENSSWHGTNIAGLIAAVTGNGKGVAGINQDGRVVPVRVAGRCGATLADIVDGMRWAAGLHVDGVPDNLNPSRIINISFGGSEACGSAYQDAINELATVQAVVVAAAGNEQGDLTRPANCSGAIAVGAVNRDGFKTNYSNFGSGMTLMTVGGDPSDFGRWGSLLGDPGLYTIDNAGTAGPVAGDAYAYVFGTSFSAPLVSGAISLMLSANPALTAAQIIDGLKRSARPHVNALRIGTCSASNPGRCICTTATCGAGLLDASEAVRFAQTMPTAVYTPPNWASVVLDTPEIDAAVALGPDVDAPVLPPAPTPSPSPSPAADSGGGGGALDAGWLAGLALAILALRRPGGRVRRV